MPPPANYRWLFEDPALATSWRVPRNPDQMTSPFQQRSTKADVMGPEARPRSWRQPQDLTEWSFSGSIASGTHHDDLLFWLQKPGLLQITDHFGRTFEVKVTEYQINERKPTQANAYRGTYSVKTLVLRRL